jgi:hypothetical protein
MLSGNGPIYVRMTLRAAEIKEMLYYKNKVINIFLKSILVECWYFKLLDEKYFYKIV